jgi:hypothetical protein
MGYKDDRTTGLNDEKFGSSFRSHDSPSVGFSDDQAQIAEHELLNKLSK